MSLLQRLSRPRERRLDEQSHDQHVSDVEDDGSKACPGVVGYGHVAQVVRQSGKQVGETAGGGARRGEGKIGPLDISVDIVRTSCSAPTQADARNSRRPIRDISRRRPR